MLQLSDFLGYREDGAYRGSNHQSDARFVVVDSDILSLERALSDAYAAADTVAFSGKYMRRDIGQRAMRAMEG